MRLSILTLTFVSVAALALYAGDTPGAATWKFDQVRLKNGTVLSGLIVEQTPVFLRFQNVRQKPGRPTVQFYTTFSASEIESVERLDALDRELLQTRLHELESGPSEKKRMERIELESIPWAGKENAGLRYRSDCFVLTSNAPEAVVRQSIVRLEQIYAAFGRFLPPRKAQGAPTRIELYRSREEYLRANGRRFVNTAFFDPAENRIVCASDSARIGDELENGRQQLQRFRADLDQREAALTRLYKGAELARFLKLIRDSRAEYDRIERKNEGIFDRAMQQFFAVLYHEAFHAYASAFVFPPEQSGLPRWLNEGLAQIFETALIEAGELRIGHADRDRLARAKDALKKGNLIPLPRLFAAEAQQFAVAHASDRATTDLYYLSSWAVAFHLTFERRLVGNEQLDNYLRDLAGGADPETAFAKFVGQPIADYERAFQTFLSQLQADGSTTSPRIDR